MTTLLDARPDGAVNGLHVAGFHGDVAADETPAKLGPVHVDAAWCHARIVEVGPTRHTPAGQVRIETFPPPLSKDAQEPLPGRGTRIGPWPARLGNTIMAVGPEERRLLRKLREAAGRRGVGRVASFLDWFATSATRSDDLCCERQDGIAIWYCDANEGFALLEAVHGAVRDELFDAIRDGDADAMEEAAWWLSRAAIADEDIWLAGAALRRVASLDWEALIRQGLQLGKKADLRKGLAKAEWHIDHPPPVASRALYGGSRTHARQELVAREPVAAWGCGAPSSRSVALDGRSLESSGKPRGPSFGTPKHQASIR